MKRKSISRQKPIHKKLRVETLEPRDLLANLVWTNRGQASDRFDGVFGAQAEPARRVVDAVLAAWSTVLVNLNQPPVDASVDRNTINFNISMDATAGGFGGGAAVDSWAFPSQADKDANRNGTPTGGTFTLNRGNAGEANNGFWIDPTPNEHSEFTNILSPFAASRPDGAVGIDLYSTINAEIAHILGLIDTTPSRLRTPLAGTVTRTTQPDRAHGNGVGFYYVFDGPSGTTLLTSWDSGGGPQGQDVGFATHTAGPTAPNFPVAFTSQFRQPAALQLRGGIDPGNAAAGEQTRVLASDNVANLLKDVFGYTIRLPSSIPGGTYAVAVQGQALTVRGGPDGDGAAPAVPPLPIPGQNPGQVNDKLIRDFRDTGGTSADRITLRRAGDDVVVTFDFGRDGPVNGLDPDGDGNAPPFTTRVPLSSFTSINLDSDGGNDTIILDLSGGDFLPAGGLTFAGDAGVDKLIVTGASSYAVNGNTLTLAGLGTVALDSVAELQLIGTAQVDTFEVKNWEGAVTLEGLAGNDAYNIDWSAGARSQVRVVDTAGTADQLNIVGTPGSDAILVTGNVVRLLAGVVDFRNSVLEQLTVDAGAGSDSILVASAPTGAALRLFGGTGNDVIQGSSGPDYISGGEGNDVINGGIGGDDILLGDAGDDLVTALGTTSRTSLIGGLGRDTLIGAGSGSLLIGGSTNYNEAALRSIQAVWARHDLAYAARLALLRFGGGANGTNVLNATTVLDDNARDTIFGSATGQDWYWSTALDLVVGRVTNEQLN